MSCIGKALLPSWAGTQPAAAGAPSPPMAHAIGGADHTASALAALSSKVSDAGVLGILGGWDADANSPTLVQGVGSEGDAYVVTVAGEGIEPPLYWPVGSLIYFADGEWRRSLDFLTPQDLNLAMSGHPGGQVLVLRSQWDPVTNNPDIDSIKDFWDFFAVTRDGTTSLGGFDFWPENSFAVNIGAEWARLASFQTLDQLNALLDDATLDDVGSPRLSKNLAYVNPQAAEAGNSYQSFAAAHAAMGGASAQGVIVPDLQVIDTGSHDGGASSATLDDSTKSWTVNEHANRVVLNLATEAFGIILSNTATSITFVNATLYDGDPVDDWNPGDAYKISDTMEISAVHDCKGVAIAGEFPFTQYILCHEGASLPGLREWTNCRLLFDGTTAPINDFGPAGSDDIALMRKGGSIGSIGSGPVIEVDAGSSAPAFLELGATILALNSPAIHLAAETVPAAGDGGSLMIIGGVFGRVAFNSISGGLGSTLIRATATSGCIGLNSTEAPQPAMLGNEGEFNFTDARRLFYDSSGSPLSSINVGDALTELAILAEPPRVIPISMSDPANQLTWAVGHWDTLETGRVVNEGTPYTGSTDQILNSEIVVNATSVSAALVLRITGDSVDESTATVVPGDTEDISIPAGGWYKSTKKWIGTVDYSVETAGESITMDLQKTRYWDASNNDFRVEGFRFEFLPSAAAWDFTYTIARVEEDGQLTTLETKTFSNADSPLWAENGNVGTFKKTGLAYDFTAGSAAGLVVLIDSSQIRFLRGDLKYRHI